jgi:hypothetical protein
LLAPALGLRRERGWPADLRRDVSEPDLRLARWALRAGFAFCFIRAMQLSFRDSQSTNDKPKVQDRL